MRKKILRMFDEAGIDLEFGLEILALFDEEIACYQLEKLDRAEAVRAAFELGKKSVTNKEISRAMVELADQISRGE